MVVFSTAALALAGPTGSVRFEKHVLTDKYYCDGINCGDFNRDGKLDIVAGPFWYEGPDFRTKHEIYLPKEFPKPPSPTDSLFSFVYDFNRDGWPDVLVVGRVHLHEAFWYENPQGQPNHWKKHFVLERVQAESPAFTDIDQDGRPEIVCIFQKQWGLVKPDWNAPARPWTFEPIIRAGDWTHFYHGTGVGDVNGDGRPDLLINDGWWERPPNGSGQNDWIAHPFKFADKGGAQMFAYDVDGDGDNDIITSLDAHGWGLAWFEQAQTGNQITFREHRIMGDRSEEAKFGVAFSQPHALDLADIDGDGLKDIVAGKRMWAHGPKGDIEPEAAPVLYWFQLTRGPGGQVRYLPHLVDDQSGVGTQVIAADVNSDGRPDILTVSKLGAFVFINRQTNRPVSSLAPPKAHALFTDPGFMETRIVFDSESAIGWSTAESTLESSIRRTRHGAPALHWHVTVDHFTGEPNYPIGWPRITTTLREPSSRDWSGWDYLQFWVYTETTRETLPHEPMGLTLYTPDKEGAFNRSLDELKAGAWVQVRIPLSDVPRHHDVRLVQFHIAESKYRHRDELDFYFDQIALLRYTQPTLLEFAPENEVLVADAKSVALRFNLAGLKPAVTVDVSCVLKLGERVVAQTKVKAARGPQRVAFDLAGAAIEPATYQIEARAAGGTETSRATVRFVESPWKRKEP